MSNRLVLKETSYHGKGAIQEIAGEVKRRGFKKAFVCSDPDLVKFGVTQKVLDVLEKNGLAYELYSNIKPNPTIENVQTGVEAFKKAETDYLIAIGGGSSMDTAKAIGIIINNPDFADVRSLEGVADTKNKAVPIFAVPTTAGTGSETTVAAVVTDPETHEKNAINDTCLRPKYAVLDPELTVGLPPHITSTTGMDALTHAVEAYIGKSNTKDTIREAEEATKLIFDNIEEAYNNGKDLEARGNMLKGSYLAGRAFTHAYVGYVHAIAHNLGGLYGTPHGLANAVILPYVLDYYADAAYPQLAKLADIVGVGKGLDTAGKGKAFIEAIRTLNKNMNIPEKFDFIKEEDLPILIERALKEGNPLYPVPKIMDKKDCEAVIRSFMA